MPTLLKKSSISLLVLFLALNISLGSGDVPEIPIEITGRVIFLKATVNGKGPLTFVLDTGATETVITPPAAKQAGIEERMIFTDQKERWVESITVGNTTVSKFPVRIFDPPQALPLRLDRGINYNGILGYTFLSRFITTIDYQRLRVRFAPLSEGPHEPNKTRIPPTVSHSISFQTSDRLIYTRGYVNGKGPFTFLVDTGSAEVLLLPHVADLLHIKTSEMSNHPGARFALIDDISLGDAKASNIPAIIQAAPPESGLSVNYDGILGHPFLSNFTVTINYQKKLLTLTPYQMAGQEGK